MSGALIGVFIYMISPSHIEIFYRNENLSCGCMQLGLNIINLVVLFIVCAFFFIFLSAIDLDGIAVIIPNN